MLIQLKGGNAMNRNTRISAGTIWKIITTGLVLVFVGCAQPKAPAPPSEPKKPWRVTACQGNAAAEVRIASRIPLPDLSVNCTSAWVSGYERVTVRFDGAFNDALVVTATWYDAQNKVINVENAFDREFALGSSATRTEVWEAPTPRAQRVRLDVSCKRC